MFFTNLLQANMRVKKIQFDMTYYPRTESTNRDILASTLSSKI